MAGYIRNIDVGDRANRRLGGFVVMFTGSVSEPDKQRNARAVNNDIRDIDVLHDAAIYNLECYTANTFGHTCPRLCCGRFPDDAIADGYIAKSGCAFGSELYGVSVTADDAIGYNYIFAYAV